MHWTIQAFDELTTGELYAQLRLRQEVFAVEQASIYLDVDGLDPQAIHISCWREGELLAYQRCLPPGLQEVESTLGRIVVAPAGRGTGLGRELVQRGIEHNLGHWPGAGIRLHAQAHLEGFYGSFGFVTEGDEYILDGIPHLEMVLRPPAGK